MAVGRHNNSGMAKPFPKFRSEHKLAAQAVPPTNGGRRWTWIYLTLIA